MINPIWILMFILISLAILSVKTQECLSFSPEKYEITITPSATGEQIVRASLPFSKGFILEGQTIQIFDGKSEKTVALRPLTWHPAKTGEPRSARRGMVTFTYVFQNDKPVNFHLKPVIEVEKSPYLPVDIAVEGENVRIAYKNGFDIKLKLLAPARTSSEKPEVETVESNANFLWRRFRFSDSEWPRVIEVRADALGEVVIIAHLQHSKEDFGRAPDFGWEADIDSSSGFLQKNNEVLQRHNFEDESQCTLLLEDGKYQIYHPAAPFKKRGYTEIQKQGKTITYRYWRCKSDEKVPMQQSTWRRAEIVIAPSGVAKLTPSLESPHRIQVDEILWDELYGIGKPLDFNELNKIMDYHHNAIIRSMAHGDDWGNVTSYSDSSPTGSIYGMNRLNHCPAIFEEGYRSGDRRLIETAVLWCDNFYDLSIWWGEGATGGTRYNNISSWKGGAPDKLYMWRSNSSVNFCTKGYGSFFMAYEQTGDPRMMEALKAQVAYAAKNVHTDQGEARNIGDVNDFVRLYEFTGEKYYLDEALRLFRELRTKLSLGDLFSQSGAPIVPNPPFIDNDEAGYKYPFAKPYIIGYALAGLPKLLNYAPDEPKLKDVVQAVADFLAESQDPIGAWRYPHPRSSYIIVSQGIEHAWQITQAGKVLGAQEKHLDVIERVLRQRIHGWIKTGQTFNGLSGWEMATGKLKNHQELHELYKTPEDRDYTMDYTKGQVSFGGSSPEGLVYFPEILAFYLKNRPASRLLTPPGEDEPLGKVLSRRK